MKDLQPRTATLVETMDLEITVVRVEGIKDPHTFTACKCYVSLTVDSQKYSTNKASFQDLAWNEGFTIPFTSTSQLDVAIQCAHKRGAEEHPIAQLMDFDVLKSELLADRTLSLSPVGEKGQSGSITLRFHFDQTRKITQSSSGLKDALNRQRVPAGAYAGMKRLEGTVTANITPPSWLALVMSLSQIAEVAKPYAELNSSAKVALTAVSAAIQIVVKQIVRDSRVTDLLEMVASIYDVLRDTNFEKITSFERTIQRLLRATTECSYFIADYCNTESIVRRAVENTVSGVDGIIGEFERRFSQLRVEFLMGSTIQVAQVAFLILEKVTKLEALLDLNMLPIMKGATWSKQLGKTQGANTDVIDEIVSWVQTDSDNHVYLLLGDAQSGKSFIAHSISQIFYQEHRLGSGIFFSNTRNDTSLFASTMARELSVLNPSVKEKIAEAISASPALAGASLDRQFDELITGPLKTLTFVGPILVVVDGLDHCEDPEAFATFIRHIPSFPPNFRFLLTSRLRPDAIQLLFSLTQYRSRLLSYELTAPLEPLIHHAARQLEERTCQIFSSSMIDAACEVVMRKAESKLCAQLSILHMLSSKTKEQATAFISQMGSGQAELPLEFKHLTVCPVHAAQEVVARSHEQSHGSLRPFTDHTSTSAGIPWSTLLLLISNPDGNANVPAPPSFQKIYQKTIHHSSMSYEEFVLSCQLHHRCVNIKDVHGIHTLYMRLLNSLFAADTICATGDSVALLFRSLLEGWVDIVVQINLEDEGFEAMLDELRQMFSIHFIRWVETMKLLGWVIGKMVNQLKRIFHWLQGKIPNDDMLLHLAIDSLRFVQLYQRDIAKGPSRVLNIIEGIPTATTLYQTYKSGDRAPTGGAKSQWPRFTYTLEEIPNPGWQPTAELGVAYSPDGMRIVAIQGRSVGIWDANSGTLIRERARMGNSLKDLVLSPDFTKLLARDWVNHTLYRWELDDTSPPEHLPIGDIYGIAHGYSSDGQIFFYRDGRRLQIQIKGNQRDLPAVKYVTSANISPDNTLIAASCGATTTTFIYDIQTMRQVLAIRSKYPMCGLAWSPCCAFLVGLEFPGGPIYLWDSSTGEQLSLINPVGFCHQFSISPDSTKLITVSGSGIKIWDISDTSKPSQLELIPEGAHSVAIAPDGRRFVVGAHPPAQPRIRVYNIEPRSNDLCRISDIQGSQTRIQKMSRSTHSRIS